MEGMRGFGTLGLQPPLDAVAIRKLTQSLRVLVADRLQVAQHQHRDIVPDSELDLR